ncbi:TPA: type II toxin-antitoxin system ParD family antitoxin [Salmonella enterica]|uniref:type II toxin-antitoxin system ParD family antitoxin n=1 Tax=Citrobacter portucalensis TaxID=1639133 RepID=UPI0012EF3905|nr:type II toxin-antitoxin system ParD family antitoxin [Citrobacter portucalensis]EBR8156151.1 type II toxin-antitoxin system ParD family antitoxin [Salmonella enterica subsp. enterica serovar Newport]EIZ2107121.1 type II toxin-antitoxin system ParD family antitoxin [Salmonella enterica]EKF5153948.1 type II toxin-antitoxin system ParD family antitoxin [Salmonella enterica]ELS7100834.1 type II toxin-antitoxin system ParD family antitoxin [Salmonella enterica]WNI87998.1 type II toxin-antitoxin 
MSTSVALSPYFEDFIREQIESGRYNNTSEVIRAGLRALEEREQQVKLESLRKAVIAGMNSGDSKSAEEIFGRLTQKYKKMAESE